MVNMITQVIDKDGYIYDVVYPPAEFVSIVSQTDTPTVSLYRLEELEEHGFRPYWVDGDLAEGLEPWERYRNGKEKWMAVEQIMRDNGYEVSNNGQDMCVKKDGKEDWIPDCVVMNHTSDEILRTETHIFEHIIK